MAALLVAMSVMAVMLSVALPAWSHMIRREKEEEMMFRADQYARAINMYQRIHPGVDPTVDVLIKERFLRKKFKDPLSPDGEFQLLYRQQRPITPPSRATSAGPGQIGGDCNPSTGRAADGATGASFGPGPSAGICGVTSKNPGQSIRQYKGKTRYNEWQFTGMEYVPHGRGAAGPGGGPPGPPGPPQRGDGRGNDGRGRNPGAFQSGTAPGRGGAPPTPFAPTPPR
jgi:type II secretory pathway pseudopilin PulG